MHTYLHFFYSAKFNLTVQGTAVGSSNINESTTVMITLAMTDTSTTNITKTVTTANIEVHMPPEPLVNETDGLDLITMAAGPIIITARTGLQVGSFQFYMVVAAIISMIAVVLTAIVTLVIYMIHYHVRSKTSKLSLTVNRTPREGQRSNNPNLQEALLVDISILPDFFVYNNFAYMQEHKIAQ